MMYEQSQADDKGQKRPTTLVHYCQRVLIANIDSISGLGEDMPHRLVKPILQGCSADTLLRLERETPHIIEDNEEIWKDLCTRRYPLAIEQYDNAERPREESVSWRVEYFELREAEAKRLEEAGNRIRNQRLEAEELKKKRQVKLTDRVPPAKRSRHGWSSGPTPPKTLFQKTRAEATKLQKSVYGAPVLPPMPSSKGYRTTFGPPSAQFSLGVDPIPVTVTTVTHRRPSVSSSPPSKPAIPSGSRSKDTSATRPKPPPPRPQQTPSTPPKPPGTSNKKDPMAALFMPKNRAHSQRPNQVASSHSVPSQ